MGSIGFWEIVTLAVLALLVFGPERLPGIARTVGRTVARVKREANATLEQFKDHADMEDLKGLTADMKSIRDDLRTTGTDLRGTGANVMAGVTGAVTLGINPAPFDSDAT